MEYPHWIENGFLDVDLGKDARQVAHCLKRQIIRWIAEDGAEYMDMVFRCSRMCWELVSSSKLTDLDAEDVRVLLTMPLNGWNGIEDLFRLLNYVKPMVVKSGWDPKAVHSASMGLARLMES